MPPVTNTAPAPQATSTGFLVCCSVGGDGVDYGQVSWAPTGHALLTPTGLSALATQAGGYHGALTSLTNGEQIRFTGPTGSYAVKNADLATQQTAIVGILNTGANVTGKAA